MPAGEDMKKILLVTICLALISCGGGGSSTTVNTVNTQMGGAIQGTQLSLAGNITTLAGYMPSADGTGAAAAFSSPSSIATDGINLYVTDWGNSTIRKIVIATGAVSTSAGTAGTFASANATGFSGPMGITTDGTNLYVTDTDNSIIRKIQ